MVLKLAFVGLILIIAFVNVRAEIECPDDPGQYLLPHPNCSLFYACEQGVATVMECPIDLYYNPEIQVCDYPHNVPECEGGTRPPVDSTTTTESPETTQPPAETTTEEPTPDDWIVIQRRGAQLDVGEERQSFYLLWEDYANGFGNPEKDFWLGLDKISSLTLSGNYELSVELQDLDGVTRFAIYSNFKVSDASDFYRLTVSGFSGNISDALSYHNGMKFSTLDRDNDESNNGNCAVYNSGAWWYNACVHSNLNGMYSEVSTPDCYVIHWRTHPESVCQSRDSNQMFTEMKIRPRNS